MPSQQDPARLAIEEHVRDAWVAAGYDVARLLLPGQTKVPDGAPFWCRVTVIFGDAFEAAQGGPGEGMNIVTGILWLSLFAPKKKIGTLTRTVDVLRNAVNRVRLEGPDHPRVQFLVPSPGQWEPDPEDQALDQMIVTVPFEVEETL